MPTGLARCWTGYVSGVPLVSVIIPTRDRNDLLAETMTSIEAQTHRHFEIIVVDDASEVKAEADGALIVRHLRPLGPGAARNTGLAHARGDYVFFLDDDDAITEQRLEWGVAQIGDERMHATAVATVSPEGRLDERRDLRFGGDMRRTLHRSILPATGQTMFRRVDCVQFDPSLRLMEDVEWWIRMTDRARFAWTDEIGLIIRNHGGHRPDLTLSRSEARLRVIARHRDQLATDRASLAYHLRRAGSAALTEDRRTIAFVCAMRSMAALPSRSAAGVGVRALSPWAKHRSPWRTVPTA